MMMREGAAVGFMIIRYLQPHGTSVRYREVRLAAIAFRWLICGDVDAVARWLVGLPEPNLNCQWLTTPEAVTSQQWTLAVASAYRCYASELGLSGSPSAVRR